MIYNILFTTFNRKIMQDIALDSIYSQKVTNGTKIRIISLDDNSNEECYESLLKKLSKSPYEYHSFRSDVQDNERTSKCRLSVIINQGFEIIKDLDKGFKEDSLIAYLPDDNIYYPNKVQVVSNIFLRFLKTDIGYNGTNLYQITMHQSTPTRLKLIQTLSMQQYPGSKYWDQGPGINFIDHQSLTHRASVLNDLEAPFWDESAAAWNHCDWAFWKKLSKFREEFKFIPIILDEKWYHNKNVQFDLDRTCIIERANGDIDFVPLGEHNSYESYCEVIKDTLGKLKDLSTFKGFQSNLKQQNISKNYSRE